VSTSKPIAKWELKLSELQSFGCHGVASGADGGDQLEQHDKAILGIMAELGQYAKEMRMKRVSREIAPNLARKRIGAILLHCAELAIMNGINLDDAVIEKINELCAMDNRYQRPESMI
jgi:hypothetical protein